MAEEHKPHHDPKHKKPHPDKRIVDALKNYNQYKQNLHPLAARFANLGRHIMDALPEHPSRTDALKKVLQARDIAFRAGQAKPAQQPAPQAAKPAAKPAMAHTVPQQAIKGPVKV
jgi:hypothetical protein